MLGMENGGNAKVNAIFEARLSGPGIKPTNHANGPTRERFIRDKYERRKYYDAAGFTEYASHQRPPVPQPAAQPEAASVGPPSDAARQRLEQRRTRINKAQSSVADDGPISSRTSKTRIKPGSRVSAASINGSVGSHGWGWCQHPFSPSCGFRR